MLQLKTFAAITAVLLTVSIPTLAQAQPQAQSQTQQQPQTQSLTELEGIELLKKVAEAYRNLKSYHFEGVEVRENRSEGMYNRTESPFVWAFEKPGKFRFEIIAPAVMRSTMVSDGETIWHYDARLRQYTKTQAPPAQKAGDSEPGMPLITHNSRIPSLADKIGGMRIADLARGAKIVREEVIDIGGQSINCYVVEVQPRIQPGIDPNAPPMTTYWVDKARSIVVRKAHKRTFVSRPPDERTEMNELITFTLVKVDESLPASLFAFTPPEWIREVPEFNHNTAFARPNLTGKPASNFVLKDLDGKSFDLVSTREKVVLLNFWSSW